MPPKSKTNKPKVNLGGGALKRKVIRLPTKITVSRARSARAIYDRMMVSKSRRYSITRTQKFYTMYNPKKISRCEAVLVYIQDVYLTGSPATALRYLNHLTTGFHLLEGATTLTPQERVVFRNLKIFVGKEAAIYGSGKAIALSIPVASKILGWFEKRNQPIETKKGGWVLHLVATGTLRAIGSAAVRRCAERVSLHRPR